MYEVYFYQDANGKQPVKEYLDKLEEKSLKSKDSHVKLFYEKHTEDAKERDKKGEKVNGGFQGKGQKRWIMKIKFPQWGKAGTNTGKSIISWKK